jgi:hypothetical protein
MKNRRKNWEIMASGILIFTVWFGVLSISAQTKQDGKSVDVKIVSELPSKEKRWALIVGIDYYEKDAATLKGAVNYAGFPENQVILLTSDATDLDNRPKRENIFGALNDLSSRVPSDGLLLFSFSGHGVSVGDQAFLIPSNGRITKNFSLLKSLSINVSEIRDAIQEIKVKQVLMLLDACRNEPGKGDTPNVLTDAYKTGFSFDTANSNIKAFATLYATSVGERAFEFYDADSKEFRGYFSYAVEEALKGKAANDKGEVTLSRLIDYLETNVAQRVRHEKAETQEPSISYSETYRANDLILTIADRAALMNARNDETTFWQAIENSTDAEDFVGYLTRINKGQFKGIYRATAELKLFRLKKMASAAAWTKLRILVRKISKYDIVREFGEGLVVVGMGSGDKSKYGLVNRNGVELTPIKYDSIEICKEGLAKVRTGTAENTKYGLVDKTGKEITPLKYNNIDPFSEGLALVRVGDWSTGKYGFLDKSGREVISPKYDYASSFSESLALVRTGDLSTGKQAFIDQTGKEVIPLKYASAGSFTEGLASVGTKTDQGEKYGFIDKTGGEVIPPRYDSAFPFSEGLAMVRIGDWSTGRYGFVDRSGREIIPFKYASSESFKDGLSKVQIGSGEKAGYGYIDKTGKDMILPKYNFINQLDGGLFVAKVGAKDAEKWGVVDGTGKEIIPFKYDQIFPAAGNFIAVGIKMGGEMKYGLIDKTDKEIVPFKYDMVLPLSIPSFDDLFLIAIGKPQTGKWGIMDKTGKEILPAQFGDSDVWCQSFVKEGFLGVKINGKKGFVDFYGNEYFDF